MKCQVINLREGRTDITLTTYVLTPHEILPELRRPAVIICPGGAYMSCSDSEGEPVAMAFAHMGYHAFVLRYGVHNEGAPFRFSAALDPDPQVKEHCVHPNPVRDIARAMLCIRDHADEWLVDVDRIAVCGFSAGAHNSAMYATNWHKPMITDCFNRPAEDFRPAACILGYCLSDYTYMKAATKGDPEAEHFFRSSNTAFLGTSDASDELLAEVSPALNVTDHCPPTFLWATSEDTMVPVQNTRLMAKALSDRKIPFELHVFENGPHGLSLATQATAASQSFIYPDVAQWVPLCGTWLKKRFALDIPALTPWEMMAQNAEH